MVAAAVAVRLSLIAEETRNDEQLFPEWLQSGQCGRELEVRTGACRQPFIVDDPVRMVDHAQAARGRGSGRGGGKRGNHGVEQRQAHDGTNTSKNGAARNGFLCHDHERGLLILQRHAATAASLPYPNKRGCRRTSLSSEMVGF